MDKPAAIEPLPEQLHQQLKILHAELPLCGSPKNALLAAPISQLQYTIALLKDKTPDAPQISLEEWESLLNLLAPHAILPLLYWKIKTSVHLRQTNPAPKLPPAKIIETLQQAYLSGSVRALKAEAALKNAITTLRQAGINYAVLKGIAYAYLVYPEPGIRPGSDIDILVDEEQFLLARAALEKGGWRGNKKVFETMRQIENEEGFAWGGSQNFPPLDLHWRLHSYPGMLKMVPTKEYLENCVRVATPSLGFQSLSPDDALLNAIIHQSTIHNQELRLIWICDIACLAKKITELNRWPAFVGKCSAAGARVAAEKMLSLAQLWTDFSLPAEFADFSRWPAPTRRELEAWKNVTQRHTSLWRWFRVRWPRGLDLKEDLKLFWRILREKRSSFRKYSGRYKKA
jgi:hypothetical protein